jgi:hypothetical protein
MPSDWRSTAAVVTKRRVTPSRLEPGRSDDPGVNTRQSGYVLGLGGMTVMTLEHGFALLGEAMP